MNTVLALNAGSSSIKFAQFQADDTLPRVLYGQVERVGVSEAKLTWHDASGLRNSQDLAATDLAASVNRLIELLEAQPSFACIRGVGHRIVHGMRHTTPERVTPELLEDLRQIIPCDPEHLPLEIELIAAFRTRHPELPQVVCFDTAFHSAMPRVARLLPIPRRFDAKGIQRYGFHGLSYAYLMQELRRLGDPAAQSGRVVLAHLGSGASMAAVRNGQSIDTSMAFTPAAGLPMGTRSGDLDPGLFSYLARTEQMTAAQFDHMVNHESGLLGVSETSSDLRDLLARQDTDVRAAEAVALFTYQAKKGLGAYAAALGGLDTLVFSAGIGENNPLVRAGLCAGLGFLGIELDAARNAENAAVISTEQSRVTVRVIHTQEEWMIAREVCRVLGLAG